MQVLAASCEPVFAMTGKEAYDSATLICVLHNLMISPPPGSFFTFTIQTFTVFTNAVCMWYNIYTINHNMRNVFLTDQLKAHARNVRLCFLYIGRTATFLICRFVSVHCLCSTLCLFHCMCHMWPKLVRLLTSYGDVFMT